MQSVHPGYFLPVVAGSFVASIGFTSMHAHDAALAAFGIGAFFWLVLGTVVTVRLMTAGELPPAARTGLSANAAAPVTASVAWIVSHLAPMGALQLGLTGVLVIMPLMQLLLIGEYRKLAFSPLFWVFTFPVATTANIHHGHRRPKPGRRRRRQRRKTPEAGTCPRLGRRATNYRDSTRRSSTRWLYKIVVALNCEGPPVPHRRAFVVPRGEASPPHGLQAISCELYSKQARAHGFVIRVRRLTP